MGCWLEPKRLKGQQDPWAGHSPEGPLEREQNSQVLSPSQGRSQLSDSALTGGQQACSEEGREQTLPGLWATVIPPSWASMTTAQPMNGETVCQ